MIDPKNLPENVEVVKTSDGRDLYIGSMTIELIGTAPLVVAKYSQKIH